MSASMLMPVTRLRSGDLVRYGDRWAQINTVVLQAERVRITLLDIDVRVTPDPAPLAGSLLLEYRRDAVIASRPDLGGRLEELQTTPAERSEPLRDEIRAVYRFTCELIGYDLVDLMDRKVPRQ